MTSIKRLVTVQGPFQLATVLAVLFYQRDRTPEITFEDTLILHGTCVGDDYELINAAMTDLATVWPWHRVISLHEFEHKLNLGAFPSRQAMHEAIYAVIGMRSTDVIFAVRNWQLSNELLLEAYATAHKVTYGDALGQIDSYATPPFVQFDEVFTLLPIRIFSYSGEPVLDLATVPHTIVDRSYFIKAIERYLQHSQKARDLSRSYAQKADSTIVVILKNGTESRLTQYEKEISIVVDAITKVASPGDRILLKRHPRETFFQSSLIQDILKDLYNLDAEIIGKDDFLGHLPLEVFMYGNRFKRVLSPLVTGTSRQLKFLFECQVDEAITDEVYRVINPARRYHYLATQYINSKVVENLDSWDGSSLVFNWQPDAPQEMALEAERNTASTFWPCFVSVAEPEFLGLLGLVNRQIADQDWPGLTDSLERVLLSPPSDTALLLDFARIAEALKRVESACRFYEIATINEPRAAAGHLGLGRCLEQLGRSSEARIALYCARKLASSSEAKQ